jgi:type III secretion protein L
MFCRYKIDLTKDASSLPQTLILRETLANYTEATQILDHAKAQAKQIMQLAEEQREELLEKSDAEVWRRANAQLKRWDTDRKAMCESLEKYATSITNQAIFALLEETPLQQRLKALMSQLLESQVPSVKAILLCHPLELEVVAQCLANCGNTLWTLRSDDTVKPQTLVLNTDEGDFRIGWASMLDTFLKQSNTPSNTQPCTSYLTHQKIDKHGTISKY